MAKWINKNTGQIVDTAEGDWGIDAQPDASLGWEPYTDPNAFGSFADPSAALGGLQGLAGDAAAYRSPGEDWARLSAAMGPFWQQRAPMSDLASRMRGRYFLGAPYLEQTTPGNISFADYLTGFTGQQPRTMADLATLRERARLAGLAGVTTAGAYESGAATPEEFAIRGRYGGMFGPDADRQAENQLEIAQLLALQKGGPGGGVYRGQLGNAIRRAMERVQRYQSAVTGKPGGFLDWYMGRYHPAATAAE